MIRVAIRKAMGAFTLDATFESGNGVTALFGASGAGKTSVVNAIAGLLRPDAGRITVDDVTLFDSATRVCLATEDRGIGYVFQEDRLFPHLTVRRNLGYGSRRSAVPGPQPTFDDVVDLLDLAPLLARLPHRLSGGEKQRVAIGRAVLSRPRLLLMDEPLANLDTARRGEILPFLEGLCRDLALPIVYVSHAIEEITRLADTLVVMDQGTVLASGGVPELTARLDLAPLIARSDAGTVLAGTIESQDRVYELTTVAFAGGRFIVPAVPGTIGTALRLRIQARDVAIATTAPADISTLNCLPGVVIALGRRHHAHREIQVDVGVPILARVTERSVVELGLEPGRRVTALIKSVAVERTDVTSS